MLIAAISLGVSCKKEEVTKDGAVMETGNGITYKLYIPENTPYKGILAVGSGNNENNPSVGSTDGAAENDLCREAAKKGYLAAIVKYRKGPGTADWNKSAEMMMSDFKNCIEAIATKYNVDKRKSAVAGYSYTTYMLYSGIALYDYLNFSQGLLGACGGTSKWTAENFKIPVYAVNCMGNNEGELSALTLYNAIPNNSPIKNKSSGFLDSSCNTHCGNSWTSLFIIKLQEWVP